MTIGPSGAAGAFQMNWPGFNFSGSVPIGEDSLAPQNGTDAAKRAGLQSEAATAHAARHPRRIRMGDTPRA